MHEPRHSGLRRRGGTTANVVIAAVVVIAALGGWRLTHPSQQWHETIDAGLDQATAENKPILVLFTASWCPPCQKLKSEVFTDGDVSRCLSERFVLVKVDLSSDSSPNHEIAFEHEVETVPTMKAFDARGSFVGEYEGPRTTDHVLNWLRSVAPGE